MHPRDPGPCTVCGDPAMALDPMADGRRCCGQPECLTVLRQATLMDEARFAIHLAAQREVVLRQRAARAARLAHQERVAALEHAADQAILAATGLAGARVVGIPLTDVTEDELPPERAAAYEDHLREVIAAAIAGGDTGPADPVRRAELVDQEALLERRPAVRARCDALCTACRGSCCHRGGEHAFLGVTAMRARLRADPELDAESLLASYLDHLPARSVPGACINQTATGCALPRELRADTCNSFYCRLLRAYLDEVAAAAADPPPVVAIQRDPHDTAEPRPVVALRVIDDAGTRELPLPEPIDAAAAASVGGEALGQEGVHQGE